MTKKKGEIRRKLRQFDLKEGAKYIMMKIVPM